MKTTNKTEMRRILTVKNRSKLKLKNKTKKTRFRLEKTEW